MTEKQASILPVDIWTIDVAPELEIPEPGRKEILSQQEMQQAARFRFAEDAGRFRIRRRALREVLGRYFQRKPSDLVFLTNENGKPRITDSEDDSVTWEFNFSHSRELAMLALVRGFEVGIDVEYTLKPLPDMYEVLKVVCSEPEYRQFLALPQAWHQEAFFKLWTIKEAYLKALGTGLSREPDTVLLKIERKWDDMVMTLNHPEEAGWQFFSFEPRQGYLAALALRTEKEIEIRQFNFS